MIFFTSALVAVVLWGKAKLVRGTVPTRVRQRSEGRLSHVLMTSFWRPVHQGVSNCVRSCQVELCVHPHSPRLGKRQDPCARGGDTEAWEGVVSQG